MNLPEDVVDHILLFGGPLCLASDPRRVAAFRIQRAWKNRIIRTWWPDGTLVYILTTDGITHGVGRCFGLSDGTTCVRRMSSKTSFFFLPNPRVRLRLLREAGRGDRLDRLFEKAQ